MFQLVLDNGQAMTLTSGQWDLPEDDAEVERLVEKGILAPVAVPVSKESATAEASSKKAEPAKEASAPVVPVVPKSQPPKTDAKSKSKAKATPKVEKATAPKADAKTPTADQSPSITPSAPAESNEGEGDEGGEWSEGESDETETVSPPVTQ